MKLQTLSIAIALSITLSGCATLNVSSDSKDNKATAAKVDQSTDTAQKMAQDAINEADKEHLKFYTPFHYREARSYYEKLTTSINTLKNSQGGLLDSLNPFGGTSPEKVQQLAHQVVELVNQGKTAKEVVKKNLDPALKQIRRLEKLNTKLYFPEAHRDHLHELRSIIMAVESNDIESGLKDQKDLVNRMYETEIQTVKHVTLNNTNTMLEHLEEKDADELTPFLYRKALNEYQAAERFISANPRDIDGVKIVGVRASNAAEHTKNVLNRIQRIQKKTLEQIIIDFENMIQPVVANLHAEDISHKDLADQIDTIQAEIRTRETQIEELKIALGKAEEVKASESLVNNTSDAKISPPLSEATNQAMAQLEQTAKDISQSTEDELEISIEDMNNLFEQFEVKVDAPSQ